MAGLPRVTFLDLCAEYDIPSHPSDQLEKSIRTQGGHQSPGQRLNICDVQTACLPS
jgi:hypothetical protein